MGSDAAQYADWKRRVRGTEPPEHGQSAYNHWGCRCNICTEANTDYHYERRHAGIRPPSHGASGYNNYGCRCNICSEANSEYRHNYNQQKTETPT